MTDINHLRAEVERLKELTVKADEAIVRQQQDLDEAADRAADCDILRAENERLRAVLGDIHAAAGNNHLIANIARAALEGK